MYLKVKGDNYKKIDDGYTSEVGCDIFVKKGDSYKIEEKWWLFDTCDVMKEIAEPTIVKVTANRIKYIFPYAP